MKREKESSFKENLVLWITGFIILGLVLVFIIRDKNKDVPLEEYEYNSLVEKLEKKYNKDIILKKIIDPEILGGIYVRIGNDIIDGTVKTRLEDLKKLMLTTE